MKTDTFALLQRLAHASLEANIVTTDEGPYLAASGRSGPLWTRDFCFAASGLLVIGREDVVRHHLSHLIFARRSEDGLVPRVLEHRSLRKRIRAKQRRGARASIDANSLVLRATALLMSRSPDEDWLERHRPYLQEILDHVLSRTDGGRRLLWQGPYEDWQDSASREGHTLYANLLAAIAFHCGNDLGLRLPAGTGRFSHLINERFRDRLSLLFRSHGDLDLISLEGNCLALNEGLCLTSESDAKLFYDRLKAHPIWTRSTIPGVASFPDYPREWIQRRMSYAGLHHYHDRLLWSWLAALAAKSAVVMGDLSEAERILTELQRIAQRDGGVGEVYRPEPGLRRFRSLFYLSELPFSWGAGMILEALESYQSASFTTHRLTSST